VSPDRLHLLNTAMDRLEALEESEYPDPLCLGTPRTERELYLSNVLEADPAFRPLVDLPPVVDAISCISGDSFRLNHTYAIWRWGGGFTGLHMHGTPIIPKCQYRCENGQMLSTLTKAVFPLLDCGPEDGGFAVIPGAHKSSLPKPWGNHPDDNPPLVPVEAKAGDCIIFTEALTHGSTVNTSGRPRRTVYFCYSIGWMPDWGGQGLHFSGRVEEGLTDAQREIIRLKM
jgi:hypothetical protein